PALRGSTPEAPGVDAAQVVGVGAEPHRARLRVEEHVADRAAHRRHREELLRLRVEADEPLLGAGLRKPDPIEPVLRERVGTRAGPAGYLPLPDLTRRRIDPAEHAARLVAVPEHPVLRPCQPSGP